MIFSSRISKKQLAGLSNRLSTSLAAGVDIRTAWAHEVRRSSGSAAARAERIGEHFAQGSSMREAFDAEGEYFPELFRELVHVGEQSGHQSEALAQLADHYEHQLKLQRTFLVALAWPLAELGITVVVIGLLIWVLGIVASFTGRTVDVLGFGLVGTRGLLIYLTFLAIVGTAIFALVLAMRAGLFWTRPIQKFLLRVPVIGRALQSLALGRLAWALHLTFNAGMDVRRAVEISLRAARNATYLDALPVIDATLSTGSSLCEAFGAAHVFPESFMDTLHVGEQTGEIVESMEKLAEQYREKARAAMQVLATIGFFVCFGIIALIIIAVIFRLAFFYLNTLYDAVEMAS